MLDIHCPKCGQPGKAPEKSQGRSVKCSKCGGPVLVPAPRSSMRWLVLIPVYLLLLGGAGAGAYFIIAPRLAPKEQTPELAEVPPATQPNPADKAKTPEPVREAPGLAAKKPADEEKARQRAEEEKAEAERRKQEEAKKALEAKRERERSEKEKAEADRKAKEEQTKLIQERRNPKLTAMPEEVERDPASYYGKRLYFDRVKFKEGAIDKVKDLKRYTVGVVSFRGRYFSRVPFSGLFFSVPDKLAATLVEKSVDWETANYLRVYCQIDPCERKKGKMLPEARIFKVEVYGKTGNLLQTWEEPE